MDLSVAAMAAHSQPSALWRYCGQLAKGTSGHIGSAHDCSRIKRSESQHQVPDLRDIAGTHAIIKTITRVAKYTDKFASNGHSFTCQFHFVDRLGSLKSHTFRRGIAIALLTARFVERSWLLTLGSPFSHSGSKQAALLAQLAAPMSTAVPVAPHASL